MIRNVISDVRDDIIDNDDITWMVTLSGSVLWPKLATVDNDFSLIDFILFVLTNAF